MAWMKGRTEGSGGAEDVGFFFSTCPIGVDKGIFKKKQNLKAWLLLLLIAAMNPF